MFISPDMHAHFPPKVAHMEYFAKLACIFSPKVAQVSAALRCISPAWKYRSASSQLVKHPPMRCIPTADAFVFNPLSGLRCACHDVLFSVAGVIAQFATRLKMLD